MKSLENSMGIYIWLAGSTFFSWLEFTKTPGKTPARFPQRTFNDFTSRFPLNRWSGEAPASWLL